MSHIQMQRMLTVASVVIHPVGNLWQTAVVCPPLKGVQGDVWARTVASDIPLTPFQGGIRCGVCAMLISASRIPRVSASAPLRDIPTRGAKEHFLREDRRRACWRRISRMTFPFGLPGGKRPHLIAMTEGYTVEDMVMWAWARCDDETYG